VPGSGRRRNPGAEIRAAANPNPPPVQRAANVRNRILYAARNGIPKVTGNVRKRLQWSADHVTGMLAVYLLIDQYPQQQAFVQQALDAYLRLLKRLDPKGLQQYSPP